jgi:hypothetical protein
MSVPSIFTQHNSFAYRSSSSLPNTQVILFQSIYRLMPSLTLFGPMFQRNTNYLVQLLLLYKDLPSSVTICRIYGHENLVAKLFSIPSRLSKTTFLLLSCYTLTPPITSLFHSLSVHHTVFHRFIQPIHHEVLILICRQGILLSHPNCL